MTDCAVPSTQITQTAFILAALFCCHALTAIAFAPIAFGYALSLGRAPLQRAIIAGFWALLLSAAYLLPSVMYSKFVSGSQNAFFMGELFRYTFFFPDLQLQRPLFTNDPFYQRLFVVFCGQLLIQILCVAAILFRVVPDDQRRTLLLLIVGLQLCIGMMLPISEPLYVLIPALQRLQFVWRFLSPATLICTIMIAILAIPRVSSFMRTAIIAGFAVSGFGLAAAYVNMGLYEHNGLMKWGVWRAKTPAIQLNVLDAYGEYVPKGGSIGAAEKVFPANLNSRPSAFVLLSGDGQISIKQRTARHLILKADAGSRLRLLLHQFWFPGWGARDLGNGESMAVTRHVDSGLIELSIAKGRRNIDLRLSVLWPEAVGMAISAASATWLLGLMVWRRAAATWRPARCDAPARGASAGGP